MTAFVRDGRIRLACDKKTGGFTCLHTLIFPPEVTSFAEARELAAHPTAMMGGWFTVQSGRKVLDHCQWHTPEPGHRPVRREARA